MVNRNGAEPLIHLPETTKKGDTLIGVPIFYDFFKFLLIFKISSQNCTNWSQIAVLKSYFENRTPKLSFLRTNATGDLTGDQLEKLALVKSLGSRINTGKIRHKKNRGNRI